MQRVTIKTNAKINLGLSILGKREDGYHDLSMVNQSIDLYDEVDISLIDKGIILDSEADIPLNEKNTAYKAADLFMKEALRKDSTLFFGVSICINKKIPIMAGVGGSSSDAAAVLFGLNKIFDIFSDKELGAIGAQIGADVPFMIEGGSMLCQGIGDKMTRVEGLFPPCKIVLAKPNVGVSAGWAYAEYDKLKINNKKGPEHNDSICQAIKTSDMDILCKSLHNDLELPVLKKYPVIAKTKDTLLGAGAKAAIMSGSGSCSFGIFDLNTDTEKVINQLKRENKDSHFMLVKAETRGCREG